MSNLMNTVTSKFDEMVEAVERQLSADIQMAVFEMFQPATQQGRRRYAANQNRQALLKEVDQVIRPKQLFHSIIG